MNKQYKTKIQFRYDTEDNWNINNPIGLLGELFIVESNNNEIQLKIAKSNINYSDLPFLNITPIQRIV